MEYLSRDNISEIFLNLDPIDALTFCSVNKANAAFCNNERPWELKAKKDFPKMKNFNSMTWRDHYRLCITKQEILDFILSANYFNGHHDDSQLNFEQIASIQEEIINDSTIDDVRVYEFIRLDLLPILSLMDKEDMYEHGAFNNFFFNIDTNIAFLHSDEDVDNTNYQPKSAPALRIPIVKGNVNDRRKEIFKYIEDRIDEYDIERMMESEDDENENEDKEESDNDEAEINVNFGFSNYRKVMNHQKNMINRAGDEELTDLEFIIKKIIPEARIAYTASGNLWEVSGFAFSKDGNIVFFHER